MLCVLELHRQRTSFSVLKSSRGPEASDAPDRLPVVELRPFVPCVWERGKSFGPETAPLLPAVLLARPAPSVSPRKPAQPTPEPPERRQLGVTGRQIPGARKRGGSLEPLPRMKPASDPVRPSRHSEPRLPLRDLSLGGARTSKGGMSLYRGKLANRRPYGRWMGRASAPEPLLDAILTYDSKSCSPTSGPSPL